MPSLRSKTLSLLSSKRAALPVEIPEIQTDEGRALVLYILPPSVAQIMQLQGSFGATGLSDAERSQKMQETSSELLVKLVITDRETGELLFENADAVREVDMRVFARLSKTLMALMTEGSKIMAGEAAGDEPETKSETKEPFSKVAPAGEPGNASSGA